MQTVSPWIERLNLMPHPEGGFYREFYRCDRATAPGLPFDGERNLATCIYYLLPAGAFSAFHRLESDELWTHLHGGTITIHTITPDGLYAPHALASDPISDASPALTIPAGHWFAAEPAPHMDSLAACFVTPGFDFQDFHIAKADELSELCPAQSKLIDRLSLR